MKDKTRLFLRTAMAALAVAAVALVATDFQRRGVLEESGETRASVETSLARWLPNTVDSARDPRLLAAAEKLARARYVSRLWVVDPEGAIVLQRNGPGEEGERVQDLAEGSLGPLLRGVRGTKPADLYRLQLQAGAAILRDGDHNDVFRPLVTVVSKQDSGPAALVALCYDVSPGTSSPDWWYKATLATALVGLVIYWLGLAAWVFGDARARGEHAVLWGLLTMATNLVGAIAYVLAVRASPGRGRPAVTS
jgi:hypothetical protein